MDLNEIRNFNFFQASKSEIVDFLGKACEELHLQIDMKILKNLVPAEQYAMVEAAIEKDTRDFLDLEQPGENTEEEIQEYVQEDIEDRSFSIKKGEDGRFVLVDNESRAVDYSEITELNASEIELEALLDAVVGAVDYCNSRYGSGKNAWEVETLKNNAQNFSNALAEIKKIKNEFSNGLEINAMLETARLAGATFSVNDLEFLVSESAASISKSLRIADAKQVYTVKPGFSEEMIESFRQEYINDENAYRIGGTNNAKLQIIPDSWTLPEVNFDFDKMQTPEFTEKILTAIEKAGPKMERYAGVYGEELKALVEVATRSKGQKKEENPKTIATEWAKRKDVALENENAQMAIEQVKETKEAEVEQRNNEEGMFIE